ncbi:MAG: UxaA family hydrolase, partial [Anaerolineaceae bacterium]|nr:UxaA family hydrolase [Anaerolineaceae bacterium]
MNIHETLYQVDPRDNVAVALVELHSGSIVRSAQSAALSVRERIPQGHKIALQAIPAGETIYRYGFPIGTASEEIAAGAWVHTHNVGLAEIHRSFAARPQTAAQTITPPIAGKTFMGYHRPNGTVGTRNFIGIISTINCANQTVRALARHFNQPGTALPPNVDGVLPIVIPMGCSIETGGEDHLRLQQTLLNLARNPNLFGCVFIGLGCEVNLMGEVLAERGIPYLAIQEENSIGNTVKKGIEIVEQLIAGAAKVKRAEAPIAALRLAFQCGGSDAYSGITANPLMGRVSDWVCSLGASTLTGETTEIFGAEQLLTCRVANEAVGAKFVRILERWQEEADRFGFSIDNNPSPGNKMGGLTNIYEKSLGAIAK